MDPLRLSRKPVHRQLAILSVRLDLLRRLWPEEGRIQELVVASLGYLYDSQPGESRYKLVEDFLTGVFSLLRRPRELIDLCDALPAQEWALDLLDRFVLSPVADGDLIAELASDAAVFERLPHEGSWVGHALLRRAQILSQDHPKRHFEIAELLPLGVDVDRVTARAILGSAFDEGELSDTAIGRLLEIFPGDSYFARALG